MHSLSNSYGRWSPHFFSPSFSVFMRKATLKSNVRMMITCRLLFLEGTQHYWNIHYGGHFIAVDVCKNELNNHTLNSHTLHQRISGCSKDAQRLKWEFVQHLYIKKKISIWWQNSLRLTTKYRGHRRFSLHTPTNNSDCLHKVTDAILRWPNA